MNMNTTLLTMAMLVLSASIVEAREIRVAPGLPSPHPVYDDLYVPFVEYLPKVSDGNLTAKILGPEVVALPQMKDALQTNLAEIGTIVPLYYGSEMPYAGIMSAVALTGREPHVMGAAATEFMVNCIPCQKEFIDLGMVYLGTGSTDVYGLITTKPVVVPEDLQGLRLRTGGAPFSRWAEHFGAAPVTMSTAEVFESISQGTLDGSVSSLSDLLTLRLMEVIKNATLISIGTYHGTSSFTASKTTWVQLSAEEREQLARAANLGAVQMTQAWGYELADKALNAAKEAGLTAVTPSPILKEASNAYALEDVKIAAQLAKENYGIDDADDLIAEFIRLVEKWQGIVDETGLDPDAIAARVQAEVWDKVDYASYGN